MSGKNERKWTPVSLIGALSGDIRTAIDSTPEGIEASEKRGQQSFVKQEILPRHTTMERDSREIIESLGIEITGNADDLFYTVKLPDGWQKVAEDHAMWSKLVDEQGRERASMFYKAAFYDRNAHISLTALKE